MIELLDNSESSEVKQIGELLHELEFEYKEYLQGKIFVEGFFLERTISKVSDIKEIHIPVKNNIDQEMLIEDLEDLAIILSDTDAVISIEKKYELYEKKCNIEISREII